MHKHLMGLALAAAVLGAASSASATMIVDFGNDPGKSNSLGAGYIAAVTQTYTFTADSVIWNAKYASAWNTAGMQVNNLSASLSSVQPTDPLTFDMRWTANSQFNPPTFYKIGITLYSDSGDKSTYLAELQGSPSANPTPFPGASSPTLTTVVSAATAGSPIANTGSPPPAQFDFAHDTLSHMDVFIQVGPGTYPATTEMELDNIQFQNNVPEPASLGLLGLGALTLLRRKR